jgi:hypothetical protein
MGSLKTATPLLRCLYSRQTLLFFAILLVILPGICKRHRRWVSASSVNVGHIENRSLTHEAKVGRRAPLASCLVVIFRRCSR